MSAGGPLNHLPPVSVAVAALAMLAVSACGTPTGATTSGPPLTTPPSTQPATTTPTTTIEGADGPVAYFFVDDVGEESLGPRLVPVFRGSSGADTPQAAMAALLAGPTDDETAGLPAISSAIPVGTRLLGVTWENGVATVDLSGEYASGGGSAAMFGRLAQVVYTLTRYQDIDRVTLVVDGAQVDTFSSEGIVLDGPQTRQDYIDQLPAIFVDRPAWGQPVDSPVTVVGVANVFEAVFYLTLTDDDGLPLFEETVTASCGTGCWGDFAMDVNYQIDRDQFGALIVWEAFAEDGSQINLREYPVRLRE